LLTELFLFEAKFLGVELAGLGALGEDAEAVDVFVPLGEVPEALRGLSEANGRAGGVPLLNLFSQPIAPLEVGPDGDEAVATRGGLSRQRVAVHSVESVIELDLASGQWAEVPPAARGGSKGWHYRQRRGTGEAVLCWTDESLAPQAPAGTFVRV